MSDKKLVISADYQSTNFDKIVQQLKNLESQAKRLGDSFSKINVNAGAKSVDDLTTHIKKATAAQGDFNRKLEESAQRFQQMAKTAQGGGYGGGYNSNLGYGKIPESRRGFSSGADTSPYAAGAPEPGGGGFGKAAKWGAALGIAGAAIGLGSDLWAQNQKLQIHDKTAGMQNYAAAQSFRNQQYQEAVSSPIGFVGFKKAQAYALRNGDSQRGKVDASGRIVGSNGNIIQNPEDMLLKSTNMSAEGNLQERDASHFSMKNMAGYGLGVGKIAGGVGAIGMGLAAGGVGALLTGGAGVAAIVSGIKDLKDTYVNVADKQIEANSGALEAQQSALAVMTSELQNQMMNPAIAHTLSTFQEMAPSLIGGARATQGRYGYGMFSGYGLSPGEEIGLAGQAVSNFGAKAAMGHGGIAQQAAGAGAVGFSLGGSVNMLGKMQAAGGDSKETFTKLMAEGVKRGLDGSVQFIEKLGETIADESYNRASGSTLGGSLEAGLFSGLNARSTINDIRENQTAGQTHKGIFQESNYFKTRGIADAIAIGRGMGIDMTETEAGALQRSSLAELAADSSDRLDPLFGGKSKAMRKQFLETSVERLGGVIASGHKGLAGQIQGAGGFQKFLTNIAKNGGDTKLLSTVAKEVLGEEDFGGLNGYFRVLGGTLEGRGLGGGAHGKLKGILPGVATTSQGLGIKRTQNDLKNMPKMLEENRGAFTEMVKNDSALQAELGIMVKKDGTMNRELSHSDMMKVAERQNQNQKEASSEASGYGSTEQLVKGINKAATALDVFAAKLDVVSNRMSARMQGVGSR